MSYRVERYSLNVTTRLTAALALCAAIAGCDSADTTPGPVAKAASDQPRDPLVGTWAGTVVTRAYGHVSTTVTVTKDGWLLASAQLFGVTHSERARLVSFADDRLLVRYRGKQYAIAAKLSGDRFTATLPGFGETTFLRQ